MIYNELGKTGIKVSKLCFGGLTVGPLQKNKTPSEGGKIIRYAFDQGVNFIDTAQLYHTYEHIKSAMLGLRREDIVISSKSYAYDEKTALSSVYEALEKLGTEYIDIFMLHEQESEHTIRGHFEALETFLKLKEKGIIRAVGLSTHAVAGVEAAIKYSNEIEVIHPILNVSGLGITDGTRDDMLEAISNYNGGIYSMKPLGGGHLLNRVEESFDFILKQKVDAVAVGMQNFDEVDYNIKRFTEEMISDDLKNRLRTQVRKLHIADWCTGCFKCVERCGQKALLKGEGRPIILQDKCVKCGYCGSVCPEFCIKVV
ncbi:aldo/keto reductase [Acidaminobacter sp. JC074]|uniref:aldo/keto reductase n=1 Tax=Acidaminobacter sp. JC074 TaxID=2530199 RepID=UPI001F1001B1|nr:aldo/keto reductase [Acidaminobacter sp. JC074]MCH4888783.1 aldo/keto reductase [Acidaminobacter sp. JC074]